MKEAYTITTEPLGLGDIRNLLMSNSKIELSQAVIEKIENCRLFLDNRINEQEEPIYGVNTGFGSLHRVKISRDKLTTLQENLVKSHACGIGDKVPTSIVKLMLLLKIRSLSYGYSGVSLETVTRLVDFYNYDILPVIYTQGSLGASGDLAPLAHLSLPLIGEGEVYFEGKILPSQVMLRKFHWKPIQLKSKEGLALLNGTQFMSAYGIEILLEAYKVSYFSDLIAALSLDAFEGRLDPFDEKVHFIRPHNGQIKTSERIREFLQNSELAVAKKKHVQDPYSFRCIPQVHGATKDTLKYVRSIFETEINSVTDNPNIFVSDNDIISGGNFHGQPLAYGLDFLKIALAELGNISERRTFQLVSGFRGLPEFLVDNPGLNSGFMIPQYTAASIVSLNKQLATPASVDSIVSSNGQEDHVSMGANSATQCFQIMKNLKSILAIELMVASQALDFRRPKRSSDFVETFHKSYRKEVPFISDDEVLYNFVNKSIQFIDSFCIDNAVLLD